MGGKGSTCKCGTQDQRARICHGDTNLYDTQEPFEYYPTQRPYRQRKPRMARPPTGITPINPAKMTKICNSVGSLYTDKSVIFALIKPGSNYHLRLSSNRDNGLKRCSSSFQHLKKPCSVTRTGSKCRQVRQFPCANYCETCKYKKSLYENTYNGMA